MTGRRVVVTRIGMVTPVGVDTGSTWRNILAGKSGIRPITHFDTGSFSTKFGGPIYEFDVEQYISKKDARKMDPFIHYGMGAAIQAIEGANLEITDANRKRIGVTIGSSIGWYHKYREWPPDLSQRWTTQNLPLFHPGQHHQHGSREPVHKIRVERSQLLHRFGLYYRRTQYHRCTLMTRQGIVDVMTAPSENGEGACDCYFWL